MFWGFPVNQVIQDNQDNHDNQYNHDNQDNHHNNNNHDNHDNQVSLAHLWVLFGVIFIQGRGQKKLNEWQVQCACLSLLKNKTELADLTHTQVI